LEFLLDVAQLVDELITHLHCLHTPFPYWFESSSRRSQNLRVTHTFINVCSVISINL